MQSQRIKILVVAIVAAMIAVSNCSAQSARTSADAVQLVQQLATNSNSPYDEKLEKSIAELGDEALPALKNELRLGIRFKELNEVLKQEKSRRYAVVRVLARIPGAESTRALVECLSDPPDNYAMRVAALKALSKRTVSTAQIQAMLGNHEPEIVLAGIDHAAGRKTAEPELRAAVERVFDTKVATAQFKNEYGASTAGPDALWDVRLAAGKALGIDLTAEKKEKVEQILAELQQEALHPTEPEVPVWTSYASRSENIVCHDLNKLAALGPPAKELVEAAAAGAEGDYAKILDMAGTGRLDSSSCSSCIGQAQAGVGPTGQRFTELLNMSATLGRYLAPLAKPKSYSALHGNTLCRVWNYDFATRWCAVGTAQTAPAE